MNIQQPRNLLFKNLPTDVTQSVLSAAEFIHLDLKDHLSKPNVPIATVNFPETGVISVLSQMEDGTLIEIATVGHEGMLGLPVAMGVPISQELVFCQVSGSAWSIPAVAFMRLVRQHPELKTLCDKYSVVLADQVARNAACSRTHTTRKRCARWLLSTQDRCDGQDFVLTQEFLSLMLGVSRTSVNIAAGELSKTKLITYVRGKVKVLNRDGLEEASCECYASMRDYATNVMGVAWIN